MEWKLPADKNTYIFRYYLPARPVYDEATYLRRMDDLVDFCVKYDVPAVMLYVDLNPYWNYSPDSMEHNEYYIGVIKIFAEKLKAKGISYQLNYQDLFGAWDGGADLRSVIDWETYVDEKGIASTSTCCTAGEKFRALGGAKLKAWSETKPDVIWIDDDIRFHNHGTPTPGVWAGTSAHRVDFGCFCDHHIAMFNEKYGTHYNREQIVDGILKGEGLSDGTECLRRMWLEFSDDCAADVCDWVETIVHSVSPETRVALMSSTPDVHSVEGRDWGRFLSELTGPHVPLIRPHFGPYTENAAREFFNSYLLVEQLKTDIQAQYDKPFEFCPEIENTRFTRWAKSLAATEYQMKLSAFLGAKGVTFSVYDLDGCVLAEEPEFGDLMQELTPYMEKMSQMDLWDWESDGFALITAPDRVAAPWNEKSVKEMFHLSTGRFWDQALLKAGIPCKYVSPAHLADVTCAALDRFTAGMLSDEELTGLLGKGLLLDAGAAELLTKRGFGAYIGVKVNEKSPCIVACEEFKTFTHADKSAIRVPSRMEGYHWNHLALEGAEEISTLVTPEGKTYPGFTRFENSLGGTVYVYATNGSLGDGFYTHHRVRLLKDLYKELSKGDAIKVNNLSYALTAVKKNGNQVALFIANMAADAIDRFTIEAPKAVKSACVIDRLGKEYPARIDGNLITCEGHPINLYQSLVVTFTY
jgi:hypothetical protein